MTEPNPDLDARLARLAARKAASGGAKPERTAEAAPTRASSRSSADNVASLHLAASDDMTPTVAAPPKRKRRRHPAAAGRILSVGLSSSAFLSMIAAFGSETSSASAAASAVKTPVTRAAPRPKIVVKDVHHTIYVDQWGRPIAAPALPKGATALPASTQPPAGSGPKQSSGGGSYGATTPGAPASWPTSPTPGGGNAPAAGGGGSSASPGAPANPVPAPSPSQPNPGPTPTTPHVTPAPTTPPATSPPVTVVTTPPPPPPPPCSGSKCP
jgi:hypothetical protein